MTMGNPETFLVSYQHDKKLLVVAEKRMNHLPNIFNYIQGDEAEDIYKKLSERRIDDDGRGL